MRDLIAGGGSNSTKFPGVRRQNVEAQPTSVLFYFERDYLRHVVESHQLSGHVNCDNLQPAISVCSHAA